MNYFILLCGGKGTRTGRDIPKQYYIHDGKPLFLYPLTNAVNTGLFDLYVIVADSSYFPFIEENVKSLNINYELVDSGSTRHKSVSNALNFIKSRKIDKDSIVCIHDSARIYTSTSTFAILFEECTRKGSAIPYKECTSAVFSSKINSYVDKSELKIIETPQMFNLDKLLTAYDNIKLKENEIADDGIIYFDYYRNLHFTPNNENNTKITTSEDMMNIKLMKEGKN